MRIIRFHGSSPKFPAGCAVCLNWAHETLELERIFIFGRHGLRLTLSVPLCFDHLSQARKRSPAQVWSSRLAWILPLLLGLAAAAELSLYWVRTGQGSLIWTLPLALFVGTSLGFTLWAILAFWVTPLFASKETKAILNIVRMTRYDPFRDLLDVRFQNDTFAELTARRSLSSLARDMTGLTCYHLEAAIHSDDVRLVGSLKTDVLLDHPPSEKEARDLLEPEAELTMVQHAGVGCFYSVYITNIERIP